MFLVGFGLVLAGSAGQGNVSTGGVILIGPFPIAFGSGPSGLALVLVSTVIGGIIFSLLILWAWVNSRKEKP